MSLLLKVFFPGLVRRLDRIITNQEIIMGTLAEATAALEALTTQVDKIKGEVQALIDLVGAGGQTTTPEFDAALARLQAAVQGVDDQNPDAPAPPPAEP